ncbi:MAG: RNA methyltransferase [Microscillaceae bacterium]|nr:RNA methyltransferase [Microscillaceae bacterium]MDW8460183.1 RNA methyltransferase [Cytophagales bacterium]
MRKLTTEELNRINIEQFKEAHKTPFVLVLDNVRSLNNIGSVFRTADAFRVEKIYLCGITGTPPQREINRTALGATESVEWEYVTHTIKAIEKLKEAGYILVALEQTDESILLQNFKIEATQKYAFIFGNEIFGVEDEVIKQVDFSVEIPQFGTKHSFNVAVSAGILLWDCWVKYNQQLKS